MANTLNPFTARLDRKSLADALRLLDKVVEKRNHIPVLSCVLLVSSGDCVTLTVSDLDIFASIQLPGDSPSSRGVAVDFSALKSAAIKAKGEHVSIADVGGAVTFRDGDSGATVRMPVRDAADFPAPFGKLAEARDMFTLDAAMLRSDLDRVRVAVSTEEARYYLNGILWHRTKDNFGNDVLRLAATDGHRLALITRPAFADLPEKFADAILPRKTCDVLGKVLAKAGADSPCYIGFGETGAGGAVFRVGRVEIRSKVIDGTFPDYSRVIPSHWDRSVTLPATTFGDAARAVTAHSTERTKAVKFSWDAAAGWMTAYATCPDNGPAMMPVPASGFTEQLSGGGAFSIGMNGKYAAELMAKWGDAPVTLGCGHAGCPIRITSETVPEYLQVLMPMRVGDEVITPDSIARLNRTPVDAFVQDGQTAVDAVAVIEAMDLSPSAKRSARCEALRKLAGMVQGAIEHKVAGGQPRRMARLAVLTKLAQLRGDDAKVAQLTAIYGHAPQSSFKAWEAGLAGDVPAVTVQPPEQDLAQIQTAEPERVQDPVEPHTVATVIIPALPGEKPMFRSLQDFKAMAGVGSRWTLRNWDSRAGEWGEPRVRTVATVRARDLGFVDGAATPLDVAAANVKGFGGRSWIGFPKQGCWTSVPAGLVITYADGAPCMMIEPAGVPFGDAAEPVEPVAVEQPGEIAVLREMVAAMAERLARLESGAQSAGTEVALPVADAPETPPAPALAENSAHSPAGVADGSHHGMTGDARARGYLDGRGGGERNPELAHSHAYTEGFADGQRARKLVDEHAETVDKKDRRIAELKCLIDELNADRQELTARAEAAEGKVARLQTRVRRLTAVFTGAKRKLATIGQDLLFARTRGATLQRELDQAKAQPRQPQVVKTDLTYSIGRKAG